MSLSRILTPGLFLLVSSAAVADEDEPAPEESGEETAPDGEETPSDEEADPGDADDPIRRGWVTVEGGDLSGAELELDEMSAWAALERLPPKVSWELGVSASFGDITYWNDHRSYAGPYIGQGMRFGWGRNLPGGDHRIGLQTNLSIEGPVPLYYTMALESMPSWDWIDRNIQVGFSIGPALLLHEMLGEGLFPGAAPAVSVRMGYSQSWSRVGRRLFIVLEPKVRLIGGEPQLLGALVIGQGRGR